jgi:polyisoprenoid-binding protein YceI
LRKVRAVLAIALAGLAAGSASAADGTFAIDPAKSAVRFTLQATLHEVIGEGKVIAGELRFDPEGGAASGTVRVDARSFRTGIDARDENMHGQVLESERFPEISFTAERLEVKSRDPNAAEVVLHGRLALHGAEHEIAVPGKLALAGGELSVVGGFTVPYVAWGLRDLSTFVLRVAKELEVQLELRGPLALPAESRAPK